MADDETKQLLRDLLATQKESLELTRKATEAYDNQAEAYEQSLAATQKQNDEQIRAVTETYKRQAEAYDQSAARYEESIRSNSTAHGIANVLRSLALVAIAVVLAYLVFFGLHKH